MSIESKIAERVRLLRKRKTLSLDQLAKVSGVSRSMISLIERGETSATASVLNRIADALDEPLASLFGSGLTASGNVSVSRFDEQTIWTDPESGYARRQISPACGLSPADLAEVTFPPGKSVAFESAIRSAKVRQLIWMLEGEMEIAAPPDSWTLKAGDCLDMVLGPHAIFSNRTSRTARYAVVLTARDAREKGE